MSIHSSLRTTKNLKGERSVFTRVERIAVLKKAGKFDEEKSSVFDLPKVRTRFKIAGAKKVKAAPAEGAAGGTVAATPVAAAGAAAKGGDKKAADKKPAEKKAAEKKK